MLKAREAVWNGDRGLSTAAKPLEGEKQHFSHAEAF